MQEISKICSPNITDVSSTVSAKTPGTSSEFTSGMRPCLEQRPQVGLRPTTPEKQAGIRTDPPVSEPKAL